MNPVKAGTILLAVLLIGQAGYRIVSDKNHPPSRLTMPGDSVPNLTIKADDAVVLTELVGAGCTLVYFFDPDCGACGLSAPTWAGSSANIVWVSVTGEPKSSSVFLQENRLTHKWATTETLYPEPLGVAGVPTIWGIQNGVVRNIVSGAAGTSASNVTMEWCSV